MKYVRTYAILLSIVLLGGFLRCWQLGQVPPSPDWDEAALGWNAYSILKTGKDEYGTWLPLSLRSFDDYKPPLYMYLTVPFVALLGLDTWVVRLPSALMGTSVIVAVFFLVNALIGLGKKQETDTYIPTIAAFLFALSPWHIQFSRIAFEANIGLGLTIWAVVLFLWSRHNQWLLSVSALLFGLSLYAYHSQRIFAPLLVALLGLVFWKQVIAQKKALILAVVVGLLTIAPLIPVLTDKTTLTRLQGTSALADKTVLLQSSARKLERDKERGDIIGLVFDNRRIVFVQKLLEGYLSHFSPRWLFITGDNARHHAPGIGLLYLFELPFFLIGLYRVATRGGPLSRVLFGWFLIAPIAASPTTELPHAIRSLVFLPTPQIFTAFGLLWVGSIRRPLQAVIVGCAAFFVVLYLNLYFFHTNREYSAFWQYGYKEAVMYAREHHDEYKKIVVSTKLEQPYMFFLYFLRYDPARYLSEGGTSSGGFEEIKNAFDIYEFRPIHWNEEKRDGETLYIGTPREITGGILKTLYYLNGQEAIIIAR